MIFSNSINRTKELTKDYPQGVLYKPHEDFQDLLLEIPGRKQNGDYRMTLNKRAITHVDMVNYFYTLANHNNYMDIHAFLSAVYTSGYEAVTQNVLVLGNTQLAGLSLTEAQLKKVVFWITLQEEINYPRSSGKQGIKLPYSRYVEALIAHENDNILTLREVINRTNNHGRNIPSLVTHTNYKHLYNFM